MKPKVLYVDDETDHLELFSAEFPDISTVTVRSAEEALSVLDDADHDIAVVLIDYHLQGISGVELAIIASRKCPEAIRILTTCNVDNGAKAALDKGLVARIIGKPWDREKMRTYLETSIKEYTEAKSNGSYSSDAALVGEVVSAKDAALKEIKSALSLAQNRIGEAAGCRRRIAALLKRK